MTDLPNFNGLTVMRRPNSLAKPGDAGTTIFIRLPVEVRREIPGGCHCTYCKAHPDQTPTWDTLALDREKGSTWTVHYPELKGAE